MTAVAIRLSAELRARWRAWLLLAVVAGLLGGLVLAVFAGARRGESALERLLVVSRPQDVTIAKGFVFQNDDVDFDRIERLPQVARVSRDRPLAALIRTRSGEQMYGGHEASVIPLASPDGSQLRTLNRPPLVAGRLPRPGSDDEILADRKAVEILGLGVGETIPVRFIWKRLLGTPAVDFGAHPDRAEVGPLARLHIVGVHARVGSDDFSGELRLPPAVYRALGGAKLGSFQDILNVQLRSGAAGIPSFRAAVDRIAGPGDFVFSPAAADRTKVQRSIELEARAQLHEPRPALRVERTPTSDLAGVAEAGDGGILRRLGDVKGIPHLLDRVDDDLGPDAVADSKPRQAVDLRKRAQDEHVAAGLHVLLDPVRIVGLGHVLEVRLVEHREDVVGDVR